MKKRNRGFGDFLSDLFWNVVLLALVAAVGYVLFTRGYLDPYLKNLPGRPTAAGVAASSAPPAATAAPQEAVQPAAPAPAPEVVPEPALPEATATPSTAASTPPATDAPIVLSTLDRRYIPQQVKLLKGTQLHIGYNGAVAGQASVPAGVVLRLVSIKGDQLEVEEGDSTQLIPATDTDILDRVRVLMRVVTAPAAAPAAADTPAPTPWTPMLQTVRRDSDPKPQ